MTKFKGTPGPWYTERDEFDLLSVGAIIDSIHGHSTTICLMSDYEEDQMPDNANLIAAAPELLEALQSMVRNWESLCTKEPIMKNDLMYGHAQSIINKALGK